MFPLPPSARMPPLTRLAARRRTERAQHHVHASTTTRANLPYLDDHIWALIMDAVETDDPCAEIGKKCATNKTIAALCADGTLYKEVSLRLGFYGLLPDWDAVVEYYRDAGIYPLPNARKYFQRVCTERKGLLHHLAELRRTTFSSEKHESVVNKLLAHSEDGPFITYLLALALKDCGETMLKFVPTNRADYVALAGVSVLHNGEALRHVPKDTPDYVEIAKIAVAEDGGALKHVPKSLPDPDYHEIAVIALNKYGESLEYVPKTRDDIAELSEIAVKSNGFALEHVPRNLPNYHELAVIALNMYGGALQDVPKTRDDYHDLAIVAVKQDGDALEYVPPDRDDFLEIAKIALTTNPNAIRYVSMKHKHYRELSKFANWVHSTM